MINKYWQETEYRLLVLFERSMTHRLKVVGRADLPDHKNNNFKNANTPKSMFLTAINCRISEKFLHKHRRQNDTFEPVS